MHPPSYGEEPTSLSEEEMFIQYFSFRIAALLQKNATPPSLAFRMLMERKVSVLNFWISCGDQWPCLQKLAQQVFNMVASSAASERNFLNIWVHPFKIEKLFKPRCHPEVGVYQDKQLAVHKVSWFGGTIQQRGLQ
jgi:hAT family C-terminal dimerisation region